MFWQAILSRPSCFFCPPRLSCLGCPDTAVLARPSFPKLSSGLPVLLFFSQLSFLCRLNFHCCYILAVFFSRSCLLCSISSFFGLSYPSSDVRAVSSPVVLSQLTYSSSYVLAILSYTDMSSPGSPSSDVQYGFYCPRRP